MKTSKNIIIPVFFSVVLAACEQANSPASKSDDTLAAIQTIEKYIAENTGNKVPAEISPTKKIHLVILIVVKCLKPLKQVSLLM